MWRRYRGRAIGRSLQPSLGLLGILDLEISVRRADGREKLEATITERPRAIVGLLAALDCQVRDDLGARENVHAVRHLCLCRLALTALYQGRLSAHQLANALKSLGRVRP